MGVVTRCSFPCSHSAGCYLLASYALAPLVVFSCYWLGSLSVVTQRCAFQPLVGLEYDIHVGVLEMLGIQKGTNNITPNS